MTESDRARRRLESRKKYDVRRVYLGEAHGPWVDLRRRSGWSDAKLAAYLLGLERGQRAGRRGKPWEQLPKKPKRKKRRRRNVNCLRHAVLWYEDHRQRCPYEPALAELDPSVGLFTTAVWQCERGHRYFQDLHSPLRPLSDSEGDDPPGSPSSSSSSSSGGCSSGSEAPPGGAPLLILGGLQLELGGGDVPCALLQGGGPFSTPPLGPQLPKTEEDEELLGLKLKLKQEEVPPPPPAAEPPPAPPQPPPAPPEDSDVSAIIYEIPKEPQRRRRSRRGRASPPEPSACPPPGSFQAHGTPPPGCRKRFDVAKRLRRRVGTPNGSRDVTCESCGRPFKHKPRGGHDGDPPLKCELCCRPPAPPST